MTYGGDSNAGFITAYNTLGLARFEGGLPAPPAGSQNPQAILLCCGQPTAILETTQAGHRPLGSPARGESGPAMQRPNIVLIALARATKRNPANRPPVCRAPELEREIPPSSPSA